MIIRNKLELSIVKKVESCKLSYMPNPPRNAVHNLYSILTSDELQAILSGNLNKENHRLQILLRHIVPILRDIEIEQLLLG